VSSREQGLCVRTCAEGEVRSAIQAAGRSSDLAERYVTMQRRGEGVFLAAWSGDRPLGYVFLKWDPPPPPVYASEWASRVAKPCACLENLFVIEEYRGKGIGSTIVLETEREAARRGFELIGLAVDPKRNPAAHALYLRLGFSDIGLPPFDASGSWTDADGVTRHYEEWCICMTKPVG